MTQRDTKQRIALDFDGVLHEYSQGYNNGRLGDNMNGWDPMIPGARTAVERMISKGFEVYVLTARDPEQWPAIYEWLAAHRFPPNIEITNIKKPAFIYVDDRAIRFTNWYDIGKYIP